MQSEQHADALRGAGLRVTAPRLAALAAVAETKHLDADGIAASVRARLGTVSTQAVYDVLNALTDAALIRRVQPDGRAARYELMLHDNHHHMLCRRCGSLEDVPCAVGHVPCLTPPGEVSFRIETAEVLYRGLCGDCAALENAGTNPAAPAPGGGE